MRELHNQKDKANTLAGLQMMRQHAPAFSQCRYTDMEKVNACRNTTQRKSSLWVTLLPFHISFPPKIPLKEISGFCVM